MRTALAKIDYAATVLGRGALDVLSLVDGAKSRHERALVWVFNFSANLHSRNRSLRFFVDELKAVAARSSELDSIDLAGAIDRILPPTKSVYRSGELDQLFQMRPRTRLDYKELGPKSTRPGVGVLYRRPALVKFLKARWLGNLNRAHQAPQPRD